MAKASTPLGDADTVPYRTQHWLVNKPAASGQRGLVVSQSLDASKVGIEILDAGGNAFDAAVAVAFALAVVEPWNSGLGGVGFALVQPAGASRALTIDYGPRSPAFIDPSAFELSGVEVGAGLFGWPEVKGETNVHGPLSFCIPTAVAGYHHLHRRWGRLPISDVIAPAIRLAKRGIPVDWFSTVKLSASTSLLRRYESSAKTYLDKDGVPPVASAEAPTMFRPLDALAETLECLSRRGLPDFYAGEVARRMIDDCRSVGSVIVPDDLSSVTIDERPAIDVAYGPYHWQLASGLTAGPTLTRVIKAIRGLEVASKPDAAWFSAVSSALRDSYRHRFEHLGDQSKKETCTSHLCVWDEAGNVVSLTTTLLSSMGSHLVLPQTGVLMNNGVMWFDPRPGRVNSIGPGKRPLTNMCPVIVREGDRPILAGGASGGRKIMAAVLQSCAFALSFGMTPDDAVAEPRIDVSSADKVSADCRLSPDVIAALARESATDVVEHAVLPLRFACPSIILRRSGQLHGASDTMSPWSAAVAQA